ncbi:hypothetical protein [Halapricum hydrolyticum]|uniref:Peptidase C39-like domain-containing protein n=1 Tax=Halapricum hydrolyticum TaxID=2979991 RepID=A0AAE3IA00_9EURY|nr:hypothetical protein [Halapricum hydrolyticum]MCU4717479.1 hypothetical protein [Halapricum hydrolyticum]MCU4726643.1 hypothetical protein [Halapricum hydrolyticum]
MSGEEGMTRRSVLKNAAVGGASLIGVTGFATGKKKQSDVSQRDARKIAKKAVGHIGTRTEFDTWCEQGVKSPELFYAKVADGDSIVYTPRAWVFPIENRGDDVGYIAIDAKQTVSPVLAYGKSEAPQRNVDDAIQVAKANGNSIHKRFLYQGGTQFGVETTDRRLVDLRSRSVTSLAPVEDRRSLLPSDKSGLRSSSNIGLSNIGGGDAPDWSGGTDDEVAGEVPNWTEDDDGGASITNYGDGADSWDGWDGCTPIAASMVIGYHEGLNDDDQDQADALIDRLHVDLGTNDNGVTLPEPPRNPFDLASQENNIYDNIPDGIESYEEGNHSYAAANEYVRLRHDTEQAIGNDNPPILSMWNGPYSGTKSGHSVAVVGYRTESCASLWNPLCTDFYYKVYNGYATDPDRVLHGNWLGALLTKVWT